MEGPSEWFNDLETTEMMCTWLCHALAGPVGAMVNGCELLREDGGCDGETMALLAASATTTAQRLKFFRAALGHSSVSHLVVTDLYKLSSDFLASWRNGIGFDWPTAESTTPVDSRQGQLVLVMILFAVECLPRGGNLVVHAQTGHVTVTATCLKDEMTATLALRGEEKAPRVMPAFFAARLARRLGGT
ncbi:MAG: hypothetical protein FD149_2160 [Rhodospirillaceae bacterium]|nr:MAG: hypothetical protein FD149_2160 [Rhodospirillaceae bacterium]